MNWTEEQKSDFRRKLIHKYGSEKAWLESQRQKAKKRWRAEKEKKGGGS